jgi:hypothetical protein
MKHDEADDDEGKEDEHDTAVEEEEAFGFFDGTIY